MQTRVKLYKALKTKSSKALPPDPDSLRQALLRVHYQVYYWLGYKKKIINEIAFEDFGWTFDGENKLVIPVWFTGSVFFIYVHSAKFSFE